MFLEGIKRDQWHEMGQQVLKYGSLYISHIKITHIFDNLKT